MSERATITKNGKLPEPVGVPGLVQYGGRVFEEFDKRLQGSRGLKTYRRMLDADPIVGSMALLIESGLRSAGYTLRDADESPKAQELTQFTQTAFDDMDGAWGDTLGEVLTYLWLGFALFETPFKVRQGRVKADKPGDPVAEMRARLRSSRYTDGRIGWQRWAPRGQDTIVQWQFDPDEGIAVAAVQQAPTDSKTRILPLYRCLHFAVRPRKGNPEGTPLTRNIHESWFYKNELNKIEAITAEKSGVGTLKMRAPENQMADSTRKADLEAKVSNFHINEQQGFLLSSERDEEGHYLWDVELMASPGANVIDLDKPINRHTRDMFAALLMKFMTLGDQGVGSYAQSVSLVDVSMFMLQAIAESTAEVINYQAIAGLMAINTLPQELAPTFVFNPVKQRDIALLAEALSKIAPYLDTGSTEFQRWLHEEFEIPLPEVTDEEEAEAEGQPVPNPDQPLSERQQMPTERTSDETPEAKREAMERRFADDDAEITEDDLAAAAAWFDQHVPEAAGLLDAKVVTQGDDT